MLSEFDLTTSTGDSTFSFFTDLYLGDPDRGFFTSTGYNLIWGAIGALTLPYAYKKVKEVAGIKPSRTNRPLRMVEREVNPAYRLKETT